MDATSLPFEHKYNIYRTRAVEHPPQPYIDTHATTTKEYSFVWVAKFRKMNFRYTSLLLKWNFS